MFCHLLYLFYATAQKVFQLSVLIFLFAIEILFFLVKFVLRSFYVAADDAHLPNYSLLCHLKLSGSVVWHYFYSNSCNTH